MPVSYEDYRKACDRYCEYYQVSEASFAAFLDVPIPQLPQWGLRPDKWEFEPWVSLVKGAEAKITMLASPHWFALLKAHEARA